MTTLRRALIGGALTLLLGVGPMSAGADLLGFVPGYDDPQPTYAWQGKWQSHPVYFPSLGSGASLYGTLFAPVSAPPRSAPLVIITPGSTVGVQAQYQWSARDLAGHGYVAFTIDPRGAGKSGIDKQDSCGPGPPSSKCFERNNAKSPDWLDAVKSGIAFALSPGDPYASLIDPNEIGAAGHSAGADALSYQQGIEPRLKAIVAWDNLISSTTGDQGNANCTNKPTKLVTPRVPALGEASETCSQFVGPDAKKTGYELWRKHGIPAMEVVFAGTQHTDWAQEDNVPGTAATGTEQQLHEFEYYTRAWFDLFLRHDNRAAATLLAGSVNGRPRGEVISSRDRSAAYLPGLGIDCENLALCRAPTTWHPASIQVRARHLVASRAGRVTVPVACRGNPRSRCDAQLELTLPAPRRQLIAQSKPFRVPAGRTRHIALKLAAAARHALHHRRLRVIVLVLSGIPPNSEHPQHVTVELTGRHRQPERQAAPSGPTGGRAHRSHGGVDGRR